MKGFKVIDMWVQIAMIVIVILLLIFQDHMIFGENFFYSYFILGGLQLISVFVHFYFPREIKIPLRNIYHILVALTILIGMIISGKESVDYLYYMLFWTPILALLYLATCIIETVRLKEKN